jgi:hypothetical protein
MNAMKFATFDKTIDEILWLGMQIDNLMYVLPLNTFSCQCLLYSLWEDFKLCDCKEMYKLRTGLVCSDVACSIVLHTNMSDRASSRTFVRMYVCMHTCFVNDAHISVCFHSLDFVEVWFGSHSKT